MNLVANERPLGYDQLRHAVQSHFTVSTAPCFSNTFNTFFCLEEVCAKFWLTDAIVGSGLSIHTSHDRVLGCSIRFAVHADARDNDARYTKLYTDYICCHYPAIVHSF
jgi:hypothetical protein